MSADEFEKTLRELYHREPFVPFLVERESERPIVIDTPDALCFSGGFAAFIGHDDLHEFSSADVKGFRPLFPEPSL